MSKGSKRRPTLVDREQVEKNWDAIFSNLANSKPQKYSIDVELDKQSERINKHKK